MKTFTKFMNERKQDSSSMIVESKLLNSSVVQMKLNSMSKQLKHQTDINKKVDILSDMITTFSLLNVFNSVTRAK